MFYCSPARSAWEHFHNNITQYELYHQRTRSGGTRSYVDELLVNMASLPVKSVDEMVKKGTQIKLVLKLSDSTKLLFKPMRSLARSPFSPHLNSASAQMR